MSEPQRSHPRGSREAAKHTTLLVADQVAERWQVPVAHVYRLARAGVLPAVKLGRYRRFRLVDVERFEEEGGADA